MSSTEQRNTAAAEPVRKTPTERNHEALMAAIQRAPLPPESSVTLSRNAKGDMQFEVVVRGADAADCEAEARRIADRLRATYPHSAELAGGAAA